MQIDTVRVLRESPGITTARVAASDGDVVVRRLDLSQTGAWSWQWLEGELKAVRRARLHHTVPTSVTSKDAHYVEFTRPFIAGLDIRQWFAQQVGLPTDVQLRLVCDLFYALGRLHRIGIAHGGVKPANVIISEDESRLLLVDASVTRTQLAAAISPLGACEAAYLPPESPGLVHPAGFTADIFAAGWVLLEALAEGKRTGAELQGVYPRPATHAELSDLIDIAGVPALLRHVFLKLLSPLSGVRYESADEVLAAVEAVLATGHGTRHCRVNMAATGRRTPAAVEPPLIGRRAELTRLSACAAGAARSAGTVTILSGESGVGKSRLLEAVAAQACNSGLALLRAGAFDQGPARPLGLFSGVLQDVLAHLSAEPLEAERVRAEMSDLLPTALLHVPGLSEIFGDLPAGQPSGGRLGDRSLAALPTAIARLICTVFSKHRPGVILVDDCQWADDLSWQVLTKLAAAITQAEARVQSHLSLICACRPEALAQVKAWENPAIAFLDLQPLSMSATQDLIRSLGKRIPDEIIDYVSRCSNGSPLEALLVFRALIDSSALRLEADRWVMDENGMASLLLPTPSAESESAGVASAQLDVLIAVLLNPLSRGARHAITQAAILGRRFPSTLLATALQESPANVDVFLFEAAQHGIVRGTGDDSATEYEFTHDRVREAVLRTSTEQSRRELHFRAAEALKGLAEPRADYDIAYHLARSDRSEAAIPYALSAGEQGLRHNALDVAEANFKVAEAGAAQCESADDEMRFRIHEGLGTVYMLLGSYDLAASELIRAYELSGPRSALEMSRLTTLLGELAFKTGRFDEAARWMRQSMHDLGIRMPGNSLLAGVFAAGEMGLLVLGWLGRKIRRRRPAASTERDRLAALLHCRLVYEWWFVRSPIWIVLAIIRSLRFANASGSIRERAQAYSTAAAISGLAPALAPLAIRLTNRSLRLCRPADEGWVIAQSHHLRGFALYAGNRYDDAIDAFDTAISAFDVVGDRWEQVAAMWQKALCLFRQGKVHDAGVLARETYWESKRRGDRIGAGTALAVWVRCLPGDVSMETIYRELSQPHSDDHTLALLHWAGAWLLFNAEQYVEALDAFERADELLRRSKIKNHFLAPILTSHVQVCRLLRDTGPYWTAEHRHIARKVRRLLLRALWSSVVFSGERPAVRRESALAFFAKGKKYRGRFMLAACARSARRYSARGEAAACSLAAARIGLPANRTVAAALSPATDATELCHQLGIRVDRGIVESGHVRAAIAASPSGHQVTRHHALLDAVSDIVASQDVDEVFDKLRDATFATTTARRVEITDALAASSRPAHSDASPVESRDRPWQSGGMKLTERIAKPVLWADRSETSLVAAFPLGESEQYEPTIEVLTALSRAVIEREGLRQESIERMVEVQEAERGRIARDLHDEFGHLFAAVMDGLGSLQSSPDTSTRLAATDIRKLVREGMKVARSVAWSLRPSGLDDLGLIGCIEQYVEDCRNIYPIRIELTTTGQPAYLAPTVATAAFRIVQEALTNVGRHSHAREASVIVIFADEALRAIVEDNGTGFDTDAARQRKSLGLIGMHERARLVGGRLAIESRPGQGTTVLVEVPIRR